MRALIRLTQHGFDVPTPIFVNPQNIAFVQPVHIGDNECSTVYLMCDKGFTVNETADEIYEELAD